MKSYSIHVGPTFLLLHVLLKNYYLMQLNFESTNTFDCLFCFLMTFKINYTVHMGP